MGFDDWWLANAGFDSGPERIDGHIAREATPGWLERQQQTVSGASMLLASTTRGASLYKWASAAFIGMASALLVAGIAVRRLSTRRVDGIPPLAQSATARSSATQHRKRYESTVGRLMSDRPADELAPAER
mmetsp:Transcript_48939/g.162051  ORF Transcript_48939/g.162051 Transcript_48939/m.162051 type:complete len:131 (-) Transcript_48939:246-638(-)